MARLRFGRAAGRAGTGTARFRAGIAWTSAGNEAVRAGILAAISGIGGSISGIGHVRAGIGHVRAGILCANSGVRRAGAGCFPCICQLFGLVSNSPHTVSGKFRKAGGNVDGINLYGRKAGTAAWTLLGRFNATPFTAQVPLTGAAPENWEFYGWPCARTWSSARAARSCR